ncbi:methylated-DNA--[protein]-cysteine S-methyltransferase [Niabella sp. CC-SYL272]|uniref:methylated-DNA--[protein]-cysteine S-methyltransferase n=1 Tax=Niabella agricola TaxID=2891571 RepID=UPI001F31AE53|nr:methylated-DNA--[protein]-cysteine S-methyltransferase [Niabella agricola]MCF3111981.1 methylated-DNA--[protein]-cysteine S-methyltransferase [Niabella agricola]
MEPHFYKEMESPTGLIRLVATATHLVGVQWRISETYVSEAHFFKDAAHPLLLEAEHQLNAYFLGKQKAFAVPVKLEGSDFQKKVWALLTDIPYGKTISYGEMARRTGDIKNVRAVGGALNKNPVPVIVPCHRVIGANGKMIGFGGGLPRKIYLLNLENPKPQLNLW